MKRLKICLLVSIFILNFLPQIYSQNFIDILNTGYYYIPENKYEDANGSFKFSNKYFNLQYPYVFKNKDIFATKLSISNYQMKDSSALNMYVVYLQLGMLKHFSDKTSLRFAVYPEISSELTDIEKNDFLMPATAILQFKRSEKFTYGFGLMYSKELFGHFLVPMIHAKWLINNSWVFYADFPSYGYLMYYPKEKFKAGLYLSSSTSSIRLSDKYNSAYLQKSHADFSLFLDLYLTKKVVLRTRGGYSIMRSLDIYKKDDTVPFTFSIVEFDDNRKQLNNNIDDAYFFDISLNYRFNY